MLPPIPHSLVPVTATQDVVKPRPDIPPVTPAEPGAQESALTLEKRHPQETEELLHEEQRRRQRRGYSAEQLAEAEPEEVEKVLGDLPRQGLWVDVEV